MNLSGTFFMLALYHLVIVCNQGVNYLEITNSSIYVERLFGRFRPKQPRRKHLANSFQLACDH
jgi:hypothetical protein